MDSLIGLASADLSIHCHQDDVFSDAKDITTTKGRTVVTAEFGAGKARCSLFIERNAHALAVAERAFRAVADRLAEIQADAAGQERVDLATVEAALALGNYTGGEEDA